MNKLYKYYKEEKGSTTVVTISILFFGVMLIMLFINFTKMFSVVERANTSSEEASLAGTSVVYEEMMGLIESFTYECGEDDGVCHLIDDFTKIKESVKSGNPSLTPNQVNRKAIDELLVNKIPTIKSPNLGNAVKTTLISSKSKISQAISQVIAENKGNISGTNVKYFNNKSRIEIRTSSTFESVETGFIGKLVGDIENVGVGIEIPFIDKIGWTHVEWEIN